MLALVNAAWLTIYWGFIRKTGYCVQNCSVIRVNLAVRIVTSRQRVNGNTGVVLVRDTSGLGIAGTGNTF
jgi:hypothetical protein